MQHVIFLPWCKTCIAKNLGAKCWWLTYIEMRRGLQWHRQEQRSQVDPGQWSSALSREKLVPATQRRQEWAARPGGCLEVACLATCKSEAWPRPLGGTSSSKLTWQAGERESGRRLRGQEVWGSFAGWHLNRSLGGGNSSGEPENISSSTKHLTITRVTSIQDEVTEEAFKRWTPSKQAISSEPMRVPRAVIVPSLALPLLLTASCAVLIEVLKSCCFASQRRREEAVQERIMSKPCLCFIHLSGERTSVVLQHM